MTAVVVGTWLGLALIVTVAMARRGHDAFQWALLGVVLGPLAVPLAVAHRERVATPPAPAGPGGPTSDEPGRVLVGVRPGTSPAEIVPALARLTSRTGPLPVTVAAVLDAEACERPSGHEAVAEAERSLGEVVDSLVAAHVAAQPVDRCVLYGDPAAALAAFARDHRCSAIVVGAGEPLTRRAVHGSTRNRLLRVADVPVVCVPGHAPRHRRLRGAQPGEPVAARS